MLRPVPSCSWTTPGNYVPNQRYADALLQNLGAMREVAGEAFIDWDAARRAAELPGESQ